MTVKLRKRFYPLGVTRLTLGMDYDLSTRDVSFKWSWKDRIIGGRLHVDRDQISLVKRFELDAHTHLDVRAAYDLHLRRTLFSVAVRPFQGVVADSTQGGFAIRKKLQVDKRAILDVRARIELPEARFSNNSTAPLSLGEGDLVVTLEQLNLKFLLQ